jgi:hypothetical protein
MTYRAEVLGVNNRVGVWELSALGMVTTANFSEIIFYSLGLKWRMDQVAAQKDGKTWPYVRHVLKRAGMNHEPATCADVWWMIR